MNEDLASVLRLQEHDSSVHALVGRQRELEARARRLDDERAHVSSALDGARGAISTHLDRQRSLQEKLQEHRRLQERNMAHLDAVKKAKEATAAMAEIDLTRRALATDEGDLRTMSGTLTSLQQAAEMHELELAETDERQAAQLEALAGERAALDAELAAARAERDAAARKVSRTVLSKYERIRSRGQAAVLYQVRGGACGHCNTAIPMQRRNMILSGRSIETCEGCGVLLYAAV
ncbi:MAG: hypothetical protein WKG32_21065 [Gemmatimonadaceae bacterium]